jgi:hypothetical protein
LDVNDFLEPFVKKTIVKKVSGKKEYIKIYQCPKCDKQGRNNGTCSNPINLLSHLIQDCPDWIAYMDQHEIVSFIQNKQKQNSLKEFIQTLQGVVV